MKKLLGLFLVAAMFCVVGCGEKIDKHVDELLKTQFAGQLQEYIKMQQDFKDISAQASAAIDRMQKAAEESDSAFRSAERDADRAQSQMRSYNMAIVEAKTTLIVDILKELKNKKIIRNPENKKHMETVNQCILRATGEQVPAGK